MREDLKFYEGWLDRTEELARALRRNAEKEGGLAVFTVGTTVKVPERGLPYLTPQRQILRGWVGGSVVFSQTQAILAARRVDGLVDRILVDSEKKLGVQIGLDRELLRHFRLEEPVSKGNTREYLEMGNLSAACAQVVRKSEFQEFKPNDLTVEAVWHLLSNRFRVLSGRKAAVIGAGNIGFKLALKLVESGMNVAIVRRDLSRGTMMADVINLTKPRSTIATAQYNPNPLQASLFSDAVLGCTDGTPAITWEMIQSMKPDGLVVDVAKGSIAKDVVERAIRAGVPVLRADVSSAIDGLIATMERNRKFQAGGAGRREALDGIFVVSGGQMGLEDDLVVDDAQSPTRVHGVADGAGDFKEPDERNRRDLERLRAWIAERGAAGRGPGGGGKP